MSKFTFYQLDVFTNRPLTGNPLAVFPQAAGLDDGTMQALAREMNLSETVFVTESANADRRVRFFTPTAEIPLAGHPTIGTWWLLSELGELQHPGDGIHRVHQETAAGILPVDIQVQSGRVASVTMVQPLPDFGPVLTDHAELGKALGGTQDTVTSALSCQIVSTALPQLMVPVTNSDALGALPCSGPGADFVAMLRRLGTNCAMCFALDSVEAGTPVHCRMFAPGLGVPEDPATGSAAGALACYLVKYDLVRPVDGVASIVMDQGLEMGRPSRIRADVAVGSNGEITEVRVGGEAITLITGQVSL